MPLQISLSGFQQRPEFRLPPRLGPRKAVLGNYLERHQDTGEIDRLAGNQQGSARQDNVANRLGAIAGQQRRNLIDERHDSGRDPNAEHVGRVMRFHMMHAFETFEEHSSGIATPFYKDGGMGPSQMEPGYVCGCHTSNFRNKNDNPPDSRRV